MLGALAHHRVTPPDQHPFTDRLLNRLARLVLENRRWMLWGHGVLLAASIFITIPRSDSHALLGLKFDMRRDALVGAQKRYHQNFLRFNKEFPLQDDLVVVVQSDDAEKNRQFVERIGARMEAETNLLHNVFYKGDLRMLGPKALLMVPEPDLRQLESTLKEFRPFLDQFSHASNLVSLFDMVNTQIRTARRHTDAQNEALLGALPAMERIIEQATEALERQGTPPAPGMEALFNAGEAAEQGSYITAADGTIYLVTAHPLNAEVKADAVRSIRRMIAITQREVPGVNVGLTGEPVLELDEMEQSQKDSLRASVVALFLCALIFIYGYRETGRPLKATVCLVIGLAYTLGFTTLTVGHLNILTITFVPILIGLAIDFGVHLITRYEEELRHGASEEDSMRSAMVQSGRGIFGGAFTTSVAFLAMGITDFKGIQEMGIICGGGLLICVVPMMTLLPVLLLRGRQNIIDHERGERLDPRSRLERLWLRRPGMVAGVVAVLSVWSALYLGQVKFDYNLLNMQSQSLPSVQFEKKLINSADKSVLFAAVLADSAEQAYKLEQKLVKLPSVASVDSMSQYLAANPQKTRKKLDTIHAIKNELRGLDFAPSDPRPVNVLELSRTLYSFYGYLGAALNEVPEDEPKLAGELRSLRNATETLRKRMLEGNASEIKQHSRKLGAFQRALFSDVGGTFEALKNQNDQSGMTVKDLPQALRDRFIGVTGKHLLQVYPKKDVWQRKNQKEFVEQLRTVDPDVTGTPVQMYEYTSLLVESYKEAAWYALGAIAVMVLIHFRSARSLLLALTPVAVGVLWLCGLMGRFGIAFNPANIMALPLLIGIGVANGIHILNRFAEEHDPGILAKSTGKAVLVSNLTTIAGFGSLMLGAHQGIKSLGFVMSCGVAACMVVSLTFVPALLKLLTRRDSGKNEPSAGKTSTTLGREEPR